MYRRVNEAKPENASNQGETWAVPKRLVQVFGQPTDEAWDSESLGAFYFLRSDDKQFTVYHRAYDTRRTKKLIQSFWYETSTAPFSIGAIDRSGVAEFEAWLQLQLA